MMMKDVKVPVRDVLGRSEEEEEEDSYDDEIDLPCVMCDEIINWENLDDFKECPDCHDLAHIDCINSYLKRNNKRIYSCL